MSEEKKSFTVKDRRHFTAEGLAREEDDARPEPAEREPVPEPGPASPEAGPPEGAPGAADFVGLLVSLAAQASLALREGEGGLPDPDAARHFVSLFEMLKDKTEGRRTREEDRVLDGILYELRMAYLTRARSGGQ
jgi:Domain of unknown function (DUF1844)